MWCHDLQDRLHGVISQKTAKVTNLVEYQVPTAVTMKSAVFWHVTPCSPVEVRWRFGGTYCLPCSLNFASRLLGLLFYPEDRGSTLLRNLTTLLKNTGTVCVCVCVCVRERERGGAFLRPGTRGDSDVKAMAQCHHTVGRGSYASRDCFRPRIAVLRSVKYCSKTE
jgi:hypothetical protein